MLEGLRGEENISELCRREGISASMYYGWSKEFLEAGKRGMRYPASEKAEIIQLVEQSHLPGQAHLGQTRRSPRYVLPLV